MTFADPITAADFVPQPQSGFDLSDVYLWTLVVLTAIAICTALSAPVRAFFVGSGQRPRLSEIQTVLAFVMLTSGVMALPNTEIPVPLAVFLTAYFAFFCIALGRASGRLYEPGRYIVIESKALAELRALHAAKPESAPTPPADIDGEWADIEIAIEQEKSR